ncbi:cinnamoyl-CoA reductase-like SNL6 [Lycium ferocissimum]|uniref:cinnamoyl-CoA reductase-like SNL6 n=1 Tax=Lycium ferocissimum TaxID=112874 RepID=UPI002814EAF4|nr:cinnamoyl-CoA reductase-like SNL6 [Lycium ferocissimum]
MGILRPDESKRIEIEEFRRMLLDNYVEVHTNYKAKLVEEEFINNQGVVMPAVQQVEEKKVCVTSGVSFLGIAIVNQLLLRGYSVRVIVDNQEDLEKLRDMENSGEMRESSNSIEAVMASLTQVETLSEAFRDCCGVFHTAAFVDPAGLSGYTKSMAEIEVTVSKNVTEACAATSSVRKCILTSSLVACIWQNIGSNSRTIDHDCWSDESICTNKKLWYALGKLKAEKVAWNVAEKSGFKLATICAGLVTGSAFFTRNPTSTIAYLKGAQEMFKNGLLAAVDVNRLAKAHVMVFEEMNKTAFGRYVSFDKVIKSEDEFEKLARETGIEIGVNSFTVTRNDIKLSNVKLSRLMSTTFRCISEH